MKMRSEWLVVVVAGLMLAQGAMVTVILQADGYSNGTGGEFMVFETGYEANYASVATYDSWWYGSGFGTFSLELNEYAVTYPSGYTVDPYAMNGGIGGGNPDPLSVGTGWLYDQYSLGTLAGYDYNPGAGRAASAAQLQEAFWWLEDELSSSYDVSENSFLSLAGSSLGMGSFEDLKGDADPLNSSVAVINFTSESGYMLLSEGGDSEPGDSEHMQSMLVRTGTVSVPDNGLTLVLLGIAVLGSLVFNRRLAKAE